MSYNNNNGDIFIVHEYNKNILTLSFKNHITIISWTTKHLAKITSKSMYWTWTEAWSPYINYSIFLAEEPAEKFKILADPQLITALKYHVTFYKSLFQPHI